MEKVCVWEKRGGGGRNRVLERGEREQRESERQEREREGGRGKGEVMQTFNLNGKEADIMQT